MAALMACAMLAQAADPIETVRARRHTAADTPVELRTLAHWDAQCRSMSLPVLSWVENPAHGRVEVREDQVTGHPAVVGNTNCDGVPVHGLRLTYTPEAGFHGSDHLSFDVRFGAEHPPVRYEFQVRVD